MQNVVKYKYVERKVICVLRKLLSKEECAECKICCGFNSSDIWEAPVITKEKSAEIISKYNPEQKFLQKEDYCILHMPKEQDKDLYFCTMLDHNKGCVMGDNKPFDCKIWPFRVMNLNKTLVITLSPVCPVVQKRTLESITEVAHELAPVIFAQADKTPQIVKPYINGYPILAVKEN